jgi:pantothenate kinase type III
MVRRIKDEWPRPATPMVIATGGFAEMFGSLCKEFDRVEPFLTLQGLQMAHALLTSAPVGGLSKSSRPTRKKTK